MVLQNNFINCFLIKNFLSFGFYLAKRNHRENPHSRPNELLGVAK
jgi:hypothetical protein